MGSCMWARGATVSTLPSSKLVGRPSSELESSNSENFCLKLKPRTCTVCMWGRQRWSGKGFDANGWHHRVRGVAEVGLHDYSSFANDEESSEISKVTWLSIHLDPCEMWEYTYYFPIYSESLTLMNSW